MFSIAIEPQIASRFRQSRFANPEVPAKIIPFFASPIFARQLQSQLGKHRSPGGIFAGGPRRRLGSRNRSRGELIVLSSRAKRADRDVAAKIFAVDGSMELSLRTARKLPSVIFSIVALLLPASLSWAQLPLFNGAEGYGGNFTGTAPAGG